MHTLLLIAGGVVLLGLFTIFGKLWGSDVASIATAARIFIPVWLVVSIVNLWIGVSRAGYTVREEFPIMLVVFAVPAIIAGPMIWYLSRG
jgi:hypothetical protein